MKHPTWNSSLAAASLQLLFEGACLLQVSPFSLCSLPCFLGVSVCDSPAWQRLGLAPPQRKLGGVLRLRMLLPVGGVQLSLRVVFSGSSLLFPPNLLLLLTLTPTLLAVTSGGDGRRRSPQSLLTLKKERGGVRLKLRVAWVPTLGHREIPHCPLLVIAGAAGSLLLGRDVGGGSGPPWSEIVIITHNAAGWCAGYRGDRGLGGDRCYRVDEGG